MTATGPFQATVRADLAVILGRLRPRTVGCFDLAELSLLPIEELVRSGASAWFVDGEAGRMKALLAGEIATSNERAACLACSGGIKGRDVCAAHVPSRSEAGHCCESREALPRDPRRCTQFVPGRKLRVIDADARRGRAAAFATRAETIVAAAATPLAAVDDALAVCHSSARLDVPLPLEDGAFELVISVLAPVRLMERPFTRFDELMVRRFGAWKDQEQPELVGKIEELQLELFRTQLEAHIRELARLTHPLRGRMYFATVPVEAANGGWILDRVIGDCIDAIARHFAFDFETFPAEAFLRRSADDRAVVLQAALLRPIDKESSQP